MKLYELLTGKKVRDTLTPNLRKSIIWASDAETIARHFEVIEGDTIGVMVPYQDGKTLIEDFNGDRAKLRLRDLKAMFHRAQPYLINAYRDNLDDLIKNGIVVPLPLLSTSEMFIYAVTDERYYDPKLGLITNPTESLTVDKYIL